MGIINKTNQNSGGLISYPDDSSSAYLPQNRGRLKEKLVRMRFNVTYRVWRRIILKYNNAYINSNAKLSFLDVGCGPGNFLYCLKKWFKEADINGLDANQHLLKYTDEHIPNIKLWQCSAENMPFGCETFDVVSGFHVIEHLPEPEKFLCQAHRILKDNGLLLLATPNTKSLVARMMGVRWIGFRDDHISLRSAKQWQQTLEKNGFKILNHGTTFFKGIPLIGDFPLGAPFQLLQSFIGWLPWQLGASYMAVAVKKKDD